MPFKKGESGNKDGRPPGSGRNRQAKEWAEEHGIPFLIRVAEGKEKSVGKDGKKREVSLYTRIECAEYLIDQGIGRAPQRHEVSGSEGEPLQITIVRASGDAKT